MPARLPALLIAALLFSTPLMARPACPPAGFDRAALADLKKNEWRIDNAAERAAFAHAIVACLASPDPALRDGVAYEALYALLRGKSLDAATMNALYEDLKATIEGPAGKGFARPFAALALAEIARADRIEPYLAPERRAELLDTAIAYVMRIDDYRGFNEKEGWRHGVAHGADLMLQLSVSQSTTRDDLLRIRDAIATQIAPEGHFYIYGESERLARPILFIAQRGLITEAEWTTWFAALPGDTSAMFASQAGLARRHNLNAFLQVIYLNARLSQNAEDDMLLPGAEAALRAMP